MKQQYWRGWSEANEKRKKKFEKLTDKINCDEIKNKSNSNYSQIYFILTKFSRHAAMEFLKKYYSRVFFDKFEFQIIKRTSLEVNYSKNSFQVCLSVLFCVIVSFMSIILGLFMDLWFYSTLLRMENWVWFWKYCVEDKWIKSYYFVKEYFLDFADEFGDLLSSFD